MSTLTSRVVAGCARSPGIREISRGGAPGRVARRRAPHSPSRSSSTTRMSPVRASAGPVDGFVPAIDAAARDVAASIPPLASSSLSVTHPIADVAVGAYVKYGQMFFGMQVPKSMPNLSRFMADIEQRDAFKNTVAGG